MGVGHAGSLRALILALLTARIGPSAPPAGEGTDAIVERAAVKVAPRPGGAELEELAAGAEENGADGEREGGREAERGDGEPVHPEKPAAGVPDGRVVSLERSVPLLQVEQPVVWLGSACPPPPRLHSVRPCHRPSGAAPWVVPTALLLGYSALHAASLSEGAGLLSGFGSELSQYSTLGLGVATFIAAGLVYENAILAAGELWRGLGEPWRCQVGRVVFREAAHYRPMPVHAQPARPSWPWRAARPAHTSVLPPTASRPMSSPPCRALHHRRGHQEPRPAGCPERCAARG